MLPNNYSRVSCCFSQQLAIFYARAAREPSVAGRPSDGSEASRGAGRRDVNVTWSVECCIGATTFDHSMRRGTVGVEHKVVTRTCHGGSKRAMHGIERNGSNQAQRRRGNSGTNAIAMATSCSWSWSSARVLALPGEKKIIGRTDRAHVTACTGCSLTPKSIDGTFNHNLSAKQVQTNMTNVRMVAGSRPTM